MLDGVDPDPVEELFLDVRIGWQKQEHRVRPVSIDCLV